MSDYDPRAEGALCDKCVLNGRHKPVPPAKAIRSTRLIVIGEGPGLREIYAGSPFVGPSGKLLDATLRHAGWSNRADIHVTNAALCAGETDWEKERAAACCAPRLAKELSELPADAPILSLGAPAAKVMLGKGSIFKSRGFVWKLQEIEAAKLRHADKVVAKRWETLQKTSQGRRQHHAKAKEAFERAENGMLRLKARATFKDRIVIPSVHPAFILRGADSWRPVLAVDVKRACRWAQKPFKLYDEGPFDVAKTAAQLKRLLKKIRTEEIVVDIETDGVDPLRTPMLMLGFSEVPLDAKPSSLDDIRVVLASPFVDSMAPVIDDFLRDRITVGHNFSCFDSIVLQRLGMDTTDDLIALLTDKPGYKRRIEDSLIAQHAYASHLRNGLDHLVSVYCDSGPWKVEFKSKGAEEKGVATFSLKNKGIDSYNRSDCALNAIAWRKMQADLEPERSVYEHDMKLAAICREMQIAGMGFDHERRLELSKRLKARAGGLLGEMRNLVGSKSFHPARPADLRRAIFGKFRVTPTTMTKTGLASTAVGTLEALRAIDSRAGKLADLALRWRAAQKTRSTFVDGVELGLDGRVHPSWRAFGTVSGRMSCRAPNLQNLTRPTVIDSVSKRVKKGEKLDAIKKEMGYEIYDLETRVRELYVAPPGYELVYFDLSQSEMRMAAYASGDDAFIASCESGDIHTANAKILFPDAIDVLTNDPKGKGKQFRDVTKNAGFGILYLAEIQTIYEFLCGQGFRDFVTMESTETMFKQIYDTYKRYYKYCEENLAFCRRHGYLRTIFTGRIRWLGQYARPTDVANIGVQPNIADLMNLRLISLVPRLPKESRVAAQIHDAVICEAKCGEPANTTERVIKELWDEPIVMPNNGRVWKMPIDAKRAERWSDL